MSDFEQFLEKIKSLQLKTSKSSDLCTICGKPLSAHIKGLALGLCIKMPKRSTLKRRSDEEQSFAA